MLTKRDKEEHRDISGKAGYAAALTPEEAESESHAEAETERDAVDLKRDWKDKEWDSRFIGPFSVIDITTILLKASKDSDHQVHPCIS